MQKNENEWTTLRVRRADREALSLLRKELLQADPQSLPPEVRSEISGWAEGREAYSHGAVVAIAIAVTRRVVANLEKKK